MLLPLESQQQLRIPLPSLSEGPLGRQAPTRVVSLPSPLEGLTMQERLCLPLLPGIMQQVLGQGLPPRVLVPQPLESHQQLQRPLPLPLDPPPQRLAPLP